MQVAEYLERIGYHGSLDPTLETLAALHRAHLRTIPYENFDIHLGRTLPLDQAKTFEKIVRQQRGGWCYEMNGLFAWALQALGYDVTMLASGVKAVFEGDGSEGEHLILMLKLDGRPYLVDVGFGNGLLEPIPLEPGDYTQGFLTYRLIRDGERWFFQNHQYGGAGFVFTLQPRTLPYFTETCQFLQTDPTGRFLTKTISFRFTPEGYVFLYGAVLHTITAEGDSQRIVDNRADYEQVLNSQFDLRLPEVDGLWDTVWERHMAWVQENG